MRRFLPSPAGAQGRELPRRRVAGPVGAVLADSSSSNIRRSENIAMIFNGLANIRGFTPSPARQVSPGKGAPWVARFAQHQTGGLRTAWLSGLDLETLNARFLGAPPAMRASWGVPACR
jgi:hypothetical protein